MVINEQEKREFEHEIHALFPSFPKEEIPEAVENMVEYWTYIIQNMDS